MRLVPLLLPSLGLLLTAVIGVEEEGREGESRIEIYDGRQENRHGLRNAISPLSSLSPPKEKMSKEDRQTRKLLRKKKKRLRELREEIRKLGGIRAVKFSHSRDEKWRRRMLARMDTIAKRLDRLETIIVGTSSPSSATVTTSKKGKMDRHFASISRSLNGEAGMTCATHRDCRPGRCCHVSTSAAAAAAAVCVRHDLSETAGCIDSCQCTLQLQCFRPKDNGTASICKKASSTDIVTGIYLNDPSGRF